MTMYSYKWSWLTVVELSIVCIPASALNVRDTTNFNVKSLYALNKKLMQF